jgi:CopG family nickel-responsive transcriptional regulator
LTAPRPDKGTRIVSLSLPQATLREIDRTVGEVGYPSRSELVRDAVRSFLRERAEVAALSGHVNGIIILVYDHVCAARVSEVRHRHMGVFKSFMHADFDGGDDCCEVLMFCGDAAKVKASYDALSATMGVKETRLFLA